MIIKGKRGEYKVQWSPSVWPFAVPIVRVKIIIPYLPFKIMYWKKVWEGSSRGRIGAEKMLPKEMKEWFQYAVNSYEIYADAWDMDNSQNKREEN